MPFTTVMEKVNKATKEKSQHEVTIKADEGVRADTTYEGICNIKPAVEGGVIAAGNASQFSDGAAVQVVMSDKMAATSGSRPSRAVVSANRTSSNAASFVQASSA